MPHRSASPRAGDTSTGDTPTGDTSTGDNITGDASRDRFDAFYREVFLPEHRQPANIALHVFGTLAALALLAWALWRGPWWLALLFPLVHAAPGLLGHRLFERDAVVGDLRVMRRDHSPLLFILANHRLTWQILTGRRPRPPQP